MSCPSETLSRRCATYATLMKGLHTFHIVTVGSDALLHTVAPVIVSSPCSCALVGMKPALLHTVAHCTPSRRRAARPHRGPWRLPSPPWLGGTVSGRPRARRRGGAPAVSLPLATRLFLGDEPASWQDGADGALKGDRGSDSMRATATVPLRPDVPTGGTPVRQDTRNDTRES
jgi:hypothetical protein